MTVSKFLGYFCNKETFYEMEFKIKGQLGSINIGKLSSMYIALKTSNDVFISYDQNWSK